MESDKKIFLTGAEDAIDSSRIALIKTMCEDMGISIVSDADFEEEIHKTLSIVNREITHLQPVYC